MYFTNLSSEDAWLKLSVPLALAAPPFDFEHRQITYLWVFISQYSCYSLIAFNFLKSCLDYCELNRNKFFFRPFYIHSREYSTISSSHLFVQRKVYKLTMAIASHQYSPVEQYSNVLAQVTRVLSQIVWHECQFCNLCLLFISHLAYRTQIVR